MVHKGPIPVPLPWPYPSFWSALHWVVASTRFCDWILKCLHGYLQKCTYVYELLFLLREPCYIPVYQFAKQFPLPLHFESVWRARWPQPLNPKEKWDTLHKGAQNGGEGPRGKGPKYKAQTRRQLPKVKLKQPRCICDQQAMLASQLTGARLAVFPWFHTLC